MSPSEPRPKMSAEQARAVLAEYPDADLSAFDVEGDVDALAVEAVAGVAAKLGDLLGA